MKNVGYCCLVVTKLEKGSQSLVKTLKYSIDINIFKGFRSCHARTCKQRDMTKTLDAFLCLSF